MYLGSFVKVNFGALFPEVADAAVSLFLVLRVTKLIIFDIYEESSNVGVGTLVIYILSSVLRGIVDGIKI
jgi:hypothetical protein